MIIQRVIVGMLETNCYILENNNEVLIIDPGDEFDKIDKYLNNNKLVGIITTHSHDDHTKAVEDFVSKYHVKVYNNTNLSEGINRIGNFLFEVIYTKGHSANSISIYFKEDKVMFVGDFVFKLSIGRWDLPSGNINDMLDSLNKIKKYPDDIVLYPGHGEVTNLGYEKLNNRYFNMNYDE